MAPPKGGVFLSEKWLTFDHISSKTRVWRGNPPVRRKRLWIEMRETQKRKSLRRLSFFKKTFKKILTMYIPYGIIKSQSEGRGKRPPNGKEERTMKHTIKYSTNEQGWSLENNLRMLGYRKTADCYWSQIFENDAGCTIILEREDNHAARGGKSPAERKKTMEIKLYKNYGVLAHEKEPVYTYFTPAAAANDRVTVDIPQVSGMNEYDEPLVTLDGRDYPLHDVLATVDDAPALRWYDGQDYHTIRLTEKKEEA